MNKFRLLLLISVVTVLLVACGGAEETPDPTEEPVAVASTDTPKPADPTPTEETTATNTVEPTEVPTEEPTTAPTEEPTVEPTATVEEVAVIDDECLACHADKERLIETASEVEDTEGESSGVG